MKEALQDKGDGLVFCRLNIWISVQIWNCCTTYFDINQGCAILVDYGSLETNVQVLQY